MFVLSAALWIDGIVHIALVIANDVNGKTDLKGANIGEFTLFNALTLVNVSPLRSFHDIITWLATSKYAIRDGIVVWRARAIYPEMRAALRIATALLVLMGRERLLNHIGPDPR
jgi:hypothetical protein